MARMEHAGPVAVTDTARFHHEEEEEGETNTSLNAHAHSSVCDRRLSRAARSLLHCHLTAILASKSKGNDDHNNHPSVWQLLEDSLAPHAYQPLSPNTGNSQPNYKCPLIPSLDLLKYHEENSVVVQPPPKNIVSSARSLGLSTRNALYQLTKRKWLATPLYECGFCGKLFTSRYYLDFHLDLHHRQQVSPASPSNNDNNYFICPATSWCPALPSCSQQALLLEPYYGPGSSGLSRHDRSTVHRSLIFQQDGCDDAVLRDAQQRCSQMLQACFADGDIRHALETNLCAITCHAQLHQWFYQAFSPQWMHAAADEWEEYYQLHHGRVGILGLLLLGGLAVWYLGHCHKTSPAKALLSNRKGSRLLQKQPQGGRTRALWRNARKSLGFASSSSSKGSKGKAKMN